MIYSTAHAAALFTIPTNTVTDLTASVTDSLADVGTLAVIVAAIAIPLLFYVARRIIGLINFENDKKISKLQKGIDKLNKDIAAEKRFFNEASNFTKGFGG